MPGQAATLCLRLGTPHLKAHKLGPDLGYWSCRSGQVPCVETRLFGDEKMHSWTTKREKVGCCLIKVLSLSHVGHVYLPVQGRRDRHPDCSPGDCDAYQLLVL